MKYNVTKDTKKIFSMFADKTNDPKTLYKLLKDTQPNTSFILTHFSGTKNIGGSQIFFNNPTNGKSGYIIFQDSEVSIASLGISKEEYGEEDTIVRYEDAKVPVKEFEGIFRQWICNLPWLTELEGDAVPLGASHPLFGDASPCVDYEKFDLIVGF